MNKTFTILAFCTVLLPMGISAQRLCPSSVRVNREIKPGSWQVFSNSRNPLHTTAQQKTTGTISRLIANYDGVGTPAGSIQNLDSSFYIFSGTHKGIDLVHTDAIITNGLYLNSDYDTGTNWSWDATTTAYKPSFRYINAYNTQNALSSSLFQVFVSGGWRNSSRYSVYYNSAGLDSSSQTEIWDYIPAVWINANRTMRTYDAAGNELTTINQTWNTTVKTWDNATRTTNTYDLTNNRISDLQEEWSAPLGIWRNYANDQYVYSATNMMLSVTAQSYDTFSNIWLNGYRAFYHYNGSDQLISSMQQNGNGLSWVNYDSTSYPTLNGAGSPLSILYYAWDGFSWKVQSRFTNTYGTGTKPTIALEEHWVTTSFVNYSRITSSYNSFDQPDNVYSEYWNGSTWAVTPSSVLRHYYYETITTTGVSGPVSGKAIQAALFPVPASDKITLIANWAQPQHFTASISDMHGRPLLQWTGDASGSYTKDISLSNLPNGIYYLRLQGQAAQWSRSFIVRH